MDLNEYIKIQLNSKVNSFDEINSLLKTLEVNETKVGKDVLKTKYKKPYEELQNKILICVMVIVLKETQNVLYFKKEDDEIMVAISDKISNFIKNSDEIKLIAEKIKEEYTLNNWFYEAIYQMKSNVVALFYLDYWFSKVKYDEDKKMHYSSISKRWYDGKYWIRPFDKDAEGYDLQTDEDAIYSFPICKEDVHNYPEFSLYFKKIV